MYKSARYYFSKHQEENTDSNKEEEPEKKEIKRHKYKGFSKEFLAKIDSHIQNATAALHDQKNKSPATLYDDFCKTHQDAIVKEIMQMKNKELTHQQQQQQPLDPLIFSGKCKKTYKNRYYMIKT